MTRIRLNLYVSATASILAAVGWFSWTSVDETEFVLITDFGRIVEILGDAPGEAGFHWKLPWQGVIRVDRRLRVFDPPTREMITGDKRNLEVSSYVVWRVADPHRYVRTFSGFEAAQERLGERVSAALSSSIGRRDLATLASTDPKLRAVESIAGEVLADIRPASRDLMGIEIIDVRLRRYIHPLEVRPAIFELIRSERRQVATALRAEGEAKHRAIVSRADRDRDAIVAKAEGESERIRGRAEAAATKILNEAHGRDPRFYEFLRTLDVYRSILDENTTVVLSASSPLLRLFNRGPELEAEPPPGSLSPAAVGSRSKEPRP